MHTQRESEREEVGRDGSFLSPAAAAASSSSSVWDISPGYVYR